MWTNFGQILWCDARVILTQRNLRSCFFHMVTFHMWVYGQNFMISTSKPITDLNVAIISCIPHTNAGIWACMTPKILSLYKYQEICCRSSTWHLINSRVDTHAQSQILKNMVAIDIEKLFYHNVKGDLHWFHLFNIFHLYTPNFINSVHVYIIAEISGLY